MFPVLSEVAQGRSFCIQWVAPSHVSSRKRRACGVVTGSGMRVLTLSSISSGQDQHLRGVAMAYPRATRT